MARVASLGRFIAMISGTAIYSLSVCICEAGQVQCEGRPLFIPRLGFDVDARDVSDVIGFAEPPSAALWCLGGTKGAVQQRALSGMQKEISTGILS